VQALSGQPRVPVLVLDGEVICDSTRIVSHLRWRREQDAAATAAPRSTGQTS
jgi:glutathione S-transferase